MTRDDILAALNDERYGPSLWWKRDRPERPLPLDEKPEFDDSDTAAARRRRAMANDFEQTAREASA